MKTTTRKLSLRFIGALVLTLAVLPGCGVVRYASAPMQQGSSQSMTPGLSLATPKGDVTFAAGAWRLSMEGVQGMLYENGAASSDLRDTTVSYSDILSFGSRRESALETLLLTILGFIIVVGMTALLIWAALDATKWD